MASDAEIDEKTARNIVNNHRFDIGGEVATYWMKRCDEAEARAERLEADVAFLAPRAFKDGEWYVDEDRDFGLSANNLVNVAFGAKDSGARPYDKWDLRACERAYAKLPAHRMTEEVRLLLVACRAALAPPADGKGGE